MYIARDKKGLLFIFNSKPVYNEKLGMFFPTDAEKTSLKLDTSLFKEVSFENSPQKINLNL